MIISFNAFRLSHSYCVKKIIYLKLRLVQGAASCGRIRQYIIELKRDFLWEHHERALWHKIKECLAVYED